MSRNHTQPPNNNPYKPYQPGRNAAPRTGGVTSWSGTGGLVFASNKPAEHVRVVKRAPTPTPEPAPTPRVAPSQKKAKVEYDSSSEFGDDDFDHTVVDHLLSPYEPRKSETPKKAIEAERTPIKNWREEGVPPKRPSEAFPGPNTPKRSKSTRTETKTPAQSKTPAQRVTSLPETPVSKPHYEVDLRAPLPQAAVCKHTYCQCAGAVEAAGRNEITDPVFESCSPRDPAVCWDTLPSTTERVDTAGMCTLHRHLTRMARSIAKLRREVEDARKSKRVAMGARAKLQVKGEVRGALDGGWDARDEDDLLDLSFRLQDEEKIYAALLRMRLPEGWKG